MKITHLFLLFLHYKKKSKQHHKNTILQDKSKLINIINYISTIRKSKEYGSESIYKSISFENSILIFEKN